jgi:DNA-binding NtrC family response regulator
VGELPPAAQVKLLRAIQEGEVEPVGARKPVKVDVRLISATNRDLIADVKAGRFREDLFYRLHVFPIAVPALRERPEDVPELTRHFLARFAAEEGKRINRVTSEALTMLTGYRWPGNVRQLENAVFRAVVLAESDAVGVAEFPQIASHVQAFVPTASVAPELNASGLGGPEAAAQVEMEPTGAEPPLADSPPVAAENGSHASLHGSHVMPDVATTSIAAMIGTLALLDAAGEVRPLDEIEAETIRFAITHYRGQMSEVARRLRIGRSTLYRKLDSLGLDTSDNETESPAL